MVHALAALAGYAFILRRLEPDAAVTSWLLSLLFSFSLAVLAGSCWAIHLVSLWWAKQRQMLTRPSIICPYSGSRPGRVLLTTGLTALAFAGGVLWWSRWRVSRYCRFGALAPPYVRAGGRSRYGRPRSDWLRVVFHFSGATFV